METKHTPGPWRATRDQDSRGNHCWRIDAPSVSLLAVLTYQNAGARAEGIADAHLIAAAPDLLAALEAVLAHEGERDISPIGTELDSAELERAKNAARAAIARAKGKS